MTLPHATISFGEAMHRQGDVAHVGGQVDEPRPQPTEATPATSTLLRRTCPSCQDSVSLAVTASSSTFYLGWICAWCLVADAADGLLDVIGVHPTREDAYLDLLSEEYWASPEWADGE